MDRGYVPVVSGLCSYERTIVGAAMKKKRLTTCLIAAHIIIACSSADIIFNVDFENPPHVAGSSPVTGSAPDRPSGISGTWDVATGVADFSTQVAVLNSSGGMGFSPGVDYVSGLHLFQWEWALVTGDNSQGELQTAFLFNGVDGAQPEVNVSFLFDGTVFVSDPLNGLVNVATFTTGQAHSFELLVNLDAATYDFSMDQNPLLSSRPMDPNPDITALGIQQPFNSATFALDNFQWQIIPEPTTLGLMLVALGALGLRVFRC
ncbi:MAG: PEP-CTERM sorting domain-containing protein [Spartobacteria bacterium]|nr:PEP-CTERM sorting domain-containing protein [Spartobacteria bacterium]